MTTAKQKKTAKAPQRRKPKQSCSINTVDSILQAAEELFLKEGYEKTTSENIAKRAGVGIGSIYDYFPNKTAIALALLESVSALIANDSKLYFSEFGKESIEESLPKLVHQIFGSYKRHKNIVITLVDSVPELKFASDIYSIEKLFYRASLIYLQIYEDLFVGKSLKTVHGLLNMVFAASIKQYLSDPNHALNEDAFLNELSSMFLTYAIAAQTHN